MPNPYFHFKQFTVHQDKCAMKVCTDACLLGAWTADKFCGAKLENILDIGCGTGLLSLMLAQKTTARIDAIEINKEAAEQAAENVAASPWANRINVAHVSLQDFPRDKKYDLIICNPPFYEADLRSPDANKNAAMHDSTLKLDVLVTYLKMFLNDPGVAVIMMPFARTAYFEKEAAIRSLFAGEKLHVRKHEKSSFFRSILLLSHQNVTAHIGEICIRDNERNYTPAFNMLMKEFYLNL